ncbi:MAG: energy transducer TonB [Proteobacteria bacterium]|nr:energy transducer TonB [Pseudomonadota bacterium]
MRAQGRRDYGGKLWTLIAARKPAGIHLDGEATVLFAVDGNGALIELQLARSSGNARLDTLALDTVRSAAPFPAPPPELESADLRFTIPFAFR